MQRFLGIAFLLFGSFSIGFTQSHQIIDSLKQLIEIQKDSLQVDTYFALAKHYRYYNISRDSFLHYAQIGLEKSKAIGYSKGQKEGIYQIGVAAAHNKEFGQSNKYFETLLKQAKSSTDLRYMAIASNGLANNYWRANQLDVALDFYHEAAQYGDSIQAYDFLPVVYLNIGTIHGAAGTYDKAIEYFHKTINTTKLSADPNSKVIGIDGYFNLIETFGTIEMLDSARYYAHLAIEKSKEIGYQFGENLFLTQLSHIELKAENNKAAINYATHFLEDLDKTFPENFDLMITAFGRLAKANVNLGNYKKAKTYVDSAMVYAEKCASFFCQRHALEAAIYVFESTDDFQNAFHFQKQYQSFNDSIINQEKLSQLQVMQSLYETEKNERQLEQLNHQNEAQRYKLHRRSLLIIGISSLGVLGLLTLYFYSQQRVLKANQTVYETEQRLLRLQINPHFLFNALSSIQTYLFKKEDMPKAVHYLSRFAELMRQVLEYSRETYISLEDEIRTLENYLSLQQLRYNHSFDYEIEVAPGINRWETQIPPILAQPFVENAIEHGKVHLIENGIIKVNFREEGKNLILTVEDNGIGREQAQQVAPKKKYKSLATAITQDRIQVLSQLAKKQFSFNIIDLPEQGTRVVFQFPLSKTI